jgi:hypothetical protein
MPGKINRSLCRAFSANAFEVAWVKNLSKNQFYGK